VKRDLPDAEARALVKKGLYEGRRVTKIIDEGARRAAIETALSQLVSGDLLVIQCDEGSPEGTVEQVHQWVGRSGRRA
jgi:cyanophycin synthetase